MLHECLNRLNVVNTEVRRKVVYQRQFKTTPLKFAGKLRWLVKIVGPARNSDTSLFRRLNGPKYFSLDRHATMPTVQCSENGTHWSEGPFVRHFKKEAH
jgi:hypothetical protein